MVNFTGGPSYTGSCIYKAAFQKQGTHNAGDNGFGLEYCSVQCVCLHVEYYILY